MLPIFQVDAFTNTLFAGNPAAVCPLEEWPDDKTLLNIAAENNLAETAFFIETDEEGVYEIRWFTPEYEVDLCGHATLATAFVIMNELEDDLTAVRFKTRQAGDLVVTKNGGWFTLDFPARIATTATAPADMLAAIGGPTPEAAFETERNWYLVYKDEQTIRDLKPNIQKLRDTTQKRPCITAPSSQKGVDFVSRFFTHTSTLTEDSVTGSTHCTLAPYWAARLNKTEMLARQLSQRGGEMKVTLKGERVLLTGQAKIYLRGLIEV